MFCSASPVLKHTQDDASQRGIFGTLLCSNFRVSFISDETPLEETVRMQDIHDLPLITIHAKILIIITSVFIWKMPAVSSVYNVAVMFQKKQSKFVVGSGN